MSGKKRGIPLGLALLAGFIGVPYIGLMGVNAAVFPSIQPHAKNAKQKLEDLLRRMADDFAKEESHVQSNTQDKMATAQQHTSGATSTKTSEVITRLPSRGMMDLDKLVAVRKGSGNGNTPLQ